MCELLGMSARRPTDVNHSLALLRPRGGEIGPHADGWGVAFYEDRAALVFKEPVPACESRCLEFIAEYNYRSTVVIGHIRKANPPSFGRSAANTHPFSRELGGRSWVFAHNGKLPGIANDPAVELGRFLPMGETDSEYLFCHLLELLARVSRREPLDAHRLDDVLRGPLRALSDKGELNILMSDGIHLLAFASTRLHHVQRTCVERGCEQRAYVIATTPLTDEEWIALEPGRLYVYREGQLALP